MLDQFNLGTISGDKPFQVEAKVSNNDLIKVGVVIFISFFLSTFLANLILKK
jgi:hypothetical protein